MRKPRYQIKYNFNTDSHLTTFKLRTANLLKDYHNYLQKKEGADHFGIYSFEGSHAERGEVLIDFRYIAAIKEID